MEDHKDVQRVTMHLCNVSTGHVAANWNGDRLLKSGEGATQNVGI